MSKRIPVIIVALFVLGVAMHHAGGLAGHGQLSAVVVEDSAKRTAAQGAIYTSAAVLKTVADRHIAWRVIDQAASGPDLGKVQWAIDAAKYSLKPTLVLKRDGEAMVFSLPATPVATAALLSRFSPN